MKLNIDRALEVAVVDHTVQVGAGLRAGLLVRRAGRDIGYCWQIGNSWQWRTPSGENYGERSSLNSALRTLVEIAGLATRPARPDYTTRDRPPITPAPKASRPAAPAPKAAPAPAPKAAPAPAAKAAPAPAPAPAKAAPIQWGNISGTDLRDAIARGLGRIKGR